MHYALLLAAIPVGCALVAATTVTAQSVPSSVEDALFTEILSSFSGYDSGTYHLKSDGTVDVLSADARTTIDSLPTAVSVSTTCGPAASGTYSYTYSAGSGSGQLTLTIGALSPRVLPIGNVFTGQSTYMLFPHESVANPRANISLRAHVSPGRTAIGGFVVDTRQWVLLRVAGPSLAKFGVSGFSPEPQMRLYRGQTALFDVRGWSEDSTTPMALEKAFELTSAFSFDRGSTDCAVLRWVSPGNYTIHATVADEANSGEVLIEVYYLPY